MTKSEQITRRWIQIVAALAAVVVILGGILFVYVKEHSVASCVNTNLSQRNAPNVADRVAGDRLNAAQDALNRAESRDVGILTDGEPDRDAAAGADLRRALGVQHRAYLAYKSQRAKDDADRARHPIGRC